jgi:hypothetical protein
VACHAKNKYIAEGQAFALDKYLSVVQMSFYISSNKLLPRIGWSSSKSFTLLADEQQ